jgi:hypothetical protein
MFYNDARYKARQCSHHTVIADEGPGSVMVGKDKRIPPSHHVTAITFLIIGIIATGILFAFTLVLNQNHTAMAQQQLQQQQSVGYPRRIADRSIDR